MAEALTLLPHTRIPSQPCGEQTETPKPAFLPPHRATHEWRTQNPQQTLPAPPQGCRGVPAAPGMQRCSCSPSSTHLPLSAEMYSSQEMVLGDGGVSDCRRTGCGTSRAQLSDKKSSAQCSCPLPHPDIPTWSCPSAPTTAPEPPCSPSSCSQPPLRCSKGTFYRIGLCCSMVMS